MKTRNDDSLRILVIGTVTTAVSGTSASLSNLVERLDGRRDVDPIFVNTELATRGPLSGLRRALRTMWAVFSAAREADLVTFHMNEPQKGLPIWLLARLRRRPFLVRWFGGVEYRTHGSWLRRRSARFMMRRADVNLLQTKRLVRQSIEDGSTCSVFFSNSRPVPDLPDREDEDDRVCRRFLFAGQVKPEKGVHELIAAGERFEDGVSVDVYGQLFEGCTQEDFSGLRRVRYQGAVPAAQMSDVMRAHDALVLPTYFPGEGYPGVIVEAYLAGIPVICTDWMSIPEIVDDRRGVLIPPRDADALYAAMRRLVDDPALYRRLRQGARDSRVHFSADVWADHFVEVCRLLKAGEREQLRSDAFRDAAPNTRLV